MAMALSLRGFPPIPFPALPPTFANPYRLWMSLLAVKTSLCGRSSAGLGGGNWSEKMEPCCPPGTRNETLLVRRLPGCEAFDAAVLTRKQGMAVAAAVGDFWQLFWGFFGSYFGVFLGFFGGFPWRQGGSGCGAASCEAPLTPRRPNPFGPAIL